MGGGSSAHTDLTHLRTHILLALAPHLRTQLLTHARTLSIGETQVRTQALSRMFADFKRVVKMEMATSSSKFYMGPPIWGPGVDGAPDICFL